MYYHPQNKMSLVDLKKSLSLPELLDYKESLTAMQMLEEAANIDAKRNSGANSK